MGRSGKFYKIKDKSYKFLSSISIPGISRIFITEIVLFKVLWTVLILISVSIGFSNIFESVRDFNQYDVITNVERLTPKSVIFPAITVCAEASYIRDHYKNETLSERTSLKNSNASIIKNFIGASVFCSDSSSFAFVFDQITSFKIPRQNLDCLRFNGATKKLTYFQHMTVTVFYC